MLVHQPGDEMVADKYSRFLRFSLSEFDRQTAVTLADHYVARCGNVGRDWGAVAAARAARATA